jgi:hypothetical protein
MEWCAWLKMASVNHYAPARLAFRLLPLVNRVKLPSNAPEEEVKKEIQAVAVSGGSAAAAAAQHIMGLISCMQKDSTSKDDMLETARWFRLAAHLGLAEAQYELGEMFLKGLFCDVHMRFARKYIRRAAEQKSIPEVTKRMTELRRCVCCGADAAPLKCSLCLEARYCDSACATKYWEHGGGLATSGGGEGPKESRPHKHTCPRTHVRGSCAGRSLANGAGGGAGGGGETR